MEPIVYRPFRSYRIIGIFISTFGLFFIILAILNILLWKSLVLLLLVPVYLAFSVYLFYMSKVTVVATDTGLQIDDPKGKKSHFTAWNELKAFHMGNSWRGHEFLVLSSEPISSKDAKRIINPSSISTKLYYDGCIVIPVDPLQNNHAIFKFTQQRISLSNSQ